MSEFLQRIANYSPKRLALLANELKHRVDALEQAAHEPIAIIGMACRFPGGANTPDLYWNLVRSGVDAITETAGDRWDVNALFDADPDAPGKLSSRFGGYLADVDQFDPGVFGIARREAQNMDPQQRLLLEVAWEALENAGIAPDAIAGSLTGVYVGVSNFDYFSLMRGDRQSLDAYSASGVAHSIASGRIAYVLGTRGPALSIDTACSSSLVATHTAVQSLRSRQCDMALSGGVNIVLAPDTTIALSKARMMAPDGRCKAFDERADGFVRGEGCGVLVLKRLSDAIAARDPIVAVIRGSASNQDGRSNGLTAPNGVAQEALLRAALADAGVEGSAVGYIEAHGTGTKLGDPIEAHSLEAAYGRGRLRGAPLFIGSVKANIGHLEAAAGVAGVIKLALVLRHGVVPRQANFKAPNPHIPWDDMHLAVPREEIAWPAADGRRMGGVSSFGFSGTNAHLILEQAPEIEPAQVAQRPLNIITASARSDEALDQTLHAYASHLSAAGVKLDEVAHAANAGKAQFNRRAAVIADAPAAAANALVKLARGESLAGAMRDAARPRPPKVAFLFTGQGAQYIGMGRELYGAHPVFAAEIDRCNEALRDEWGEVSLLDVLNEDAARLQDTTYAQPALFAIEYALAKLWMSWGVQPAAVAGHSLGELVAACVAGIVSLEQGVRFAAVRGRLMGALPSGGAMSALMTDEAQAAALVSAVQDCVSIAAFNGPLSTVISGAADEVEKIGAGLRSQGVSVTPLKVSHAFHSPLMEPALGALLEQAAAIQWRAPEIELVSNVTGKSMGAAAPTANYWREHARSPVRFAQSIKTLADSGCNAFIEIGPHPTLLAMAQLCAVDDNTLWLPSLRRGASDYATLLNSLAAFYVAGGAVDWERFDAPFAVRPDQLPNYPFQRERFWLQGTSVEAASAPKAANSAASGTAQIDKMLYEVNWREASVSTADEIGAAIAPSVDAAIGDGRLADYADFAKALDRLCALYILAALRSLGWKLAPGSVATRDMPARLGVAAQHGRLFARMLEILEEEGVLKRTGDEWRVIAAPPSDDPEVVADALLLKHSDCAAELQLTRRCAAALADVLRNQADPLEVLFPGGSLGDAEQLYQYSPVALVYNALVGDAVMAIARGAAGRPLRILEVGAGTGATTAAILEQLGNTPYEYTFTDVSPLFLSRARDKFASQTSMRFELLDLERDPVEQGFALAGYDIVIGANVVHATRDLGLSCTRLRSLLASDGKLVLLEVVMPQRYGDLTVGMLEGWWAFVDTQRRNYALISRDAWREVLQASGFAAVATKPETGHGPVFDKYAVLIAAPESAAPRRWAIIPDANGMAGDVAAALRTKGRSVTVLDPAPEVFAEQIGSTKGALGVVSLGALDSKVEYGAIMQAQQRLLTPALALVQALSARSAPTRLYFATSGAQATGPGETSEPAQATLWGLSHVVELEHAEFACGRVDVDPAASRAVSAEMLAQELCADGSENQVAFRNGERLVRRLTGRVPQMAAPMRIDAKAGFLVTGGLRGLGVLVGEWLVDRGAQLVVLMGRSAPSDHAKDAIKRMEGKGARVIVCSGNVSDRADVDRAVGEIRSSGAELGGVFHCAGVLDDGVLTAQSWERFETVLAPKVQGGWNLHDACGDAPLVFFSSGVAVAGTVGQSNHAAANAFEDALAWLRQAQGKPSLSINWGPWAEVGAAAERRIAQTFLRPISPGEGMAALSTCLSVNPDGLFASTQVAVFDADWSELSARRGGVSPLFSQLVHETRQLEQARGVARPAAVESSWRARVLSAPENRRLAQLRDELRTLVGSVLGAPAASIDPDEPLRDLGLDSLMAVELRNRLGKAVETQLPASVTFDFPTVAELTAFLVRQGVFGLTSTEAPADAAPDDADRYKDQNEAELAAALAARLDALQI
jgi:microcystin synthetase protein McyG